MSKSSKVTCEITTPQAVQIIKPSLRTLGNRIGGCHAPARQRHGGSGARRRQYAIQRLVRQAGRSVTRQAAPARAYRPENLVRETSTLYCYINHPNQAAI
ncbi:hypothetical protein HZ326_30742 [Fusarium oxysporum f. sp. albedinis]|nr:hypothetical protein HZ326_30742 [Fusarium oxysporum f. sp. albedinis]